MRILHTQVRVTDDVDPQGQLKDGEMEKAEQEQCNTMHRREGGKPTRLSTIPVRLNMPCIHCCHCQLFM